MTQQNLFVNDYENPRTAYSYKNLRTLYQSGLNRNQIGIIIPFNHKIKMTQEHFNKFVDDTFDHLPEKIIANSNNYGLSRLNAMLLFIEEENGNDLHEFVEIKDQKHAYRIKEELVGVLADWSFGDQYLAINDDGSVGCSSDCEGYKYTRSEFEKLPEAVRNLFDEVEEEK